MARYHVSIGPLQDGAIKVEDTDTGLYEFGYSADTCIQRLQERAKPKPPAVTLPPTEPKFKIGDHVAVQFRNVVSHGRVVGVLMQSSGHPPYRWQYAVDGQVTSDMANYPRQVRIYHLGSHGCILFEENCLSPLS